MSIPYIKVLSTKHLLGKNCVLWARTKQPRLPFGLWTLKDKTKIINKWKPKEGDVAIIRTTEKEGHVAMVAKVGKSHITIQEANWISGAITERHGSALKLNIVGYFRK